MVAGALSGDYVRAVQQEITGLYGNNIGVITPKAILQTRQQFQSGNSSFTLAIAFIALLVGAVGIITTLYTSVNERTKEIGTMKAIGAKSRFILVLFLVEALFIGLLGATLGIMTGIGGAYVLTSGSGPRTPGSGGAGPGAGTSHIAPDFVAVSLFNVWILSVLLSLSCGFVSSVESFKAIPSRGS